MRCLFSGIVGGRVFILESPYLHCTPPPPTPYFFSAQLFYKQQTMSSITQAEWRFKVTRSPPRFPRALSIFTEITGEGCLFGRSTLFHRLTLWPSSLSSLTSLGELTKFHLWRSCVRACVRVCSRPFAESWKKEGKRRRGEEKGREEKECARHSHLPGRITRFRCCVRMSGTGGPCERALSFLPPDSEILPLLLYLFAFPPPPFFFFLFLIPPLL